MFRFGLHNRLHHSHRRKPDKSAVAREDFCERRRVKRIKGRDSRDHFRFRFKCRESVLTYHRELRKTVPKQIGKPRQTNSGALLRGRGPTAHQITFTANQIIKG
jgi:hypothetical protein